MFLIAFEQNKEKGSRQLDLFVFIAGAFIWIVLIITYIKIEESFMLKGVELLISLIAWSIAIYGFLLVVEK